MATYENWMNRKKGKQYTADRFKLDTKNKTPEQNIREIIQGLYLKKPVQNETSPTSKSGPSEFRSGLRNVQRNGSDSRRVSYLHALVTLISKEDRSNLGFAFDELMTCIRISLVDESIVIRQAALRVLRYLIKTESDVATFNTLKLPYLVIRSMDLMLRNEEERAQALRVVRRVIGVVGTGQARRNRAAYIEHGLLRCLVAVARAGSAGDGTGDRLSRPAIATLAELCVLNPEVFILCGGVSAVSRQLGECATPRMAEALCGVLLHTLNSPATRASANIDLASLAAPYCDFHMRPVGNDSSREEREMRFTCSRLALVCVLRSWPGLLHFCHPDSTGGLRALVAALYLPRLEVRKAILDLLYELVGLPQPEWTDEISVALDAVDPSDFQDTWRLNEGFVAAEGTSILPHLSSTGPDITEIHLALLLQCFLEAGLLDGLAEVIVTSDTFISVRATVLLGQLLHLIHLFLPPQLCSITPALPTLMSQASAGKPQALAAVAALRRLHSLLEARPASNSLFLDHIIQYCSGAFKERDEDMTKSKKEKDNANMAKPKHNVSLHKESSIELLNESDNENEPKQRHSIGSRADVATRNVSALVKSKSVSSRTSAAVSKVTKTAKFLNVFERDSDSLIRCTLVMQNKDGNTWNWEIIRTILKENNGEPMLNLCDSMHRAWVARIINYLKPSSNKYSHTDLSATCHGHSATRAGCQLIRQLLKHNDADSQRLLEELFYDVSRQIEAIETGRKAHECLFSPQHMCNTMCQMYFLFIGQLCHSHTGLQLFKQTRLYENLLELSTKTHHSCYVKLVISSLDYTLDSYPRDILAKTLTCNIQPSRLYATQFLNVLLRASRKSRELVRRKSKLKKNFIQEHLRSHKEENDTSGVDMDSWILKMLIGQVKDESKEVVKCALTILEEAFSVSTYVEKLMPMKDTLCQNCRLDKTAEPSSLDFSAVGDRGYLMWLSLEVASAAQTGDSKSIAFLKKHLEFWTKSYNYRYVRLVEAGVQEALTLCSGARPGARARRAARPPPHLHAALVQRPLRADRSDRTDRNTATFARALLASTLPSHYKTLQRKKCATEQEIMDLKATLWAIGNTAVTSQGLQQLMNLSNGYLEDSVPVHIVRLAKYCPVYSVRATAFYVLGLVGSTYDGANILSDLGWLCVRHTRHDQFPIIPDEIYLNYEPNIHNVTSPDRRVNAFDVDASEHSDHTDQSVAESLPSEYTKNKDDQKEDVVDLKQNFTDGRREPDKRKSHTLPIQGCSTSHERPTLSESRTVDILRDCSNYERPLPYARAENRLIGRMNSLEHAHEGRVRNTSESSTSGVSSCDSFLGKYAIPDRVLTLSPIPSSSSLYGMKSSNSSQRPKISDLQRRTSTSSFTTQDVSSSPPTQLDMSGYATLKSLNKHRRPHLSESAATGSSDIDDLSWLLTDSNRRTRYFSSLRDRAKSTRERMTKMSLLEYDWKPLPLSEPPPPPPSEPRAAAAPPPPPPHPPRAAPLHDSYIGICLPRDLKDLFPREDDIKEGNANKDNSKRGRVPSFLMDLSNASTENRSRATPDSQKLASYRGGDVVRSAVNYVGNSIAAAAGPSSILRPGSGMNPREVTNVSIESTGVATVQSRATSGKTIATSSTNSDGETSTTVGFETPKGDGATGKPNARTEADEIQANSPETMDKETSRDAVDGKNASKHPAASEVTAHAPGKLDVITEVITTNVGVTAIETVPSTSTSGVRSNVSTTASEGGTKSSEGGASCKTARAGRAAGAAPGAEPVPPRALHSPHSPHDCLACVPTRPPSAHELREAFFASMDQVSEVGGGVSPVPDRSPRTEVLHHVHFMANPIHLRQTRSALLSLKQRHPDVFRSPCVYSDVCALLSRDTYMLCARRFLHELFLDTNFDCFASEPAAILARHPAPAPSTS